MGKPKHDAESYRVLCIILVVIALFLGWRWYVAEENRLKILDELNAANEKIETLESELLDARRYY